jgi:hypothetical protein
MRREAAHEARLSLLSKCLDIFFFGMTLFEVSVSEGPGTGDDQNNETDDGTENVFEKEYEEQVRHVLKLRNLRS